MGTQKSPRNPQGVFKIWNNYICVHTIKRNVCTLDESQIVGCISCRQWGHWMEIGNFISLTRSISWLLQVVGTTQVSNLTYKGVVKIWKPCEMLGHHRRMQARYLCLSNCFWCTVMMYVKFYFCNADSLNCTPCYDMGAAAIWNASREGNKFSHG